MIVKPKITNEEFLNEYPTSIKRNTMHKISFGPFSNPIFKLDACVIKYPIGRFDKIVVEHEHDILEKLNSLIKSALGDEASKYVEMKPNELGIKISSNKKDQVSKFEKFDVIDLLVEFNNCWCMAGKIYTSFVLKDVKESEEPKHNVDEEFLFTDL